MSRIFNINSKDRRDIAASLGSSIPAIIVTSPLEVIKMNAQVTPSGVTIRGMFTDVYRTHGLRGFYQGLGVSLCGQPLFWALYHPIKNNLTSHYTQQGGGCIGFWEKSGSIFVASLAASMTVNPFFVAKTRFQTSVLKKNPDGSLKYPNSLKYAQLTSDIWQREGVRGFYKGNMVAQVKNTQLVPQILLYEYIKDAAWNPLQSSHFVLIDKSFVAGITAKTIASCVVYYPIDVIRTNIRDNVENKSLTQIMRSIKSRPGGLLNFYRGVSIYWISAVPTFGLLAYGMDKLQKLF